MYERKFIDFQIKEDFLFKVFCLNDFTTLPFHLNLISFCVMFLVERDKIYNHQNFSMYPWISLLDHKHYQDFHYCDHVLFVCHYILEEIKTVDKFEKDILMG